MCQVNGKAEILTPMSFHIFQPSLVKLQTKKDIWDTTRHAKFGWRGTTGRESAQGVHFRWLVFFPFFVFLPSPPGHTRRSIMAIFSSKRGSSPAYLDPYKLLTLGPKNFRLGLTTWRRSAIFRRWRELPTRVRVKVKVRVGTVPSGFHPSRTTAKSWGYAGDSHEKNILCCQTRQNSYSWWEWVTVLETEIGF